MSRLTVEGLVVELGGTEILHGVALEIPDGAFGVIVGPSGCGKSTLLRAVAGLRAPAEGRVTLGGTVLSDVGAFVAPEQRRVGWVPQDPSLFPHLTVAQNIAFGRGGHTPRGRRRDPGAQAAIDELLELTGLAALAGRYPDQLSGGQAQRVALARALAAEPRLLLLDEPFAALDPQLRVELREDLRSMLRRLDVTGLMVTHDQAEALDVADTIVVMREGRVLQQDTPVALYRSPVSAWLADFFGEAVFLDGVAAGRAAVTTLGDVALSEAHTGPVSVMLRPEQLDLDADGAGAAVTRVRYGGHDAIVELITDDGLELLARTHAARIPAVGDRTGVRVRGRGIAYPARGGQGAPGAEAEPDLTVRY